MTHIILRALEKHGCVGTCNIHDLTARTKTLLFVDRCEADEQRMIAARALSPINVMLPATEIRASQRALENLKNRPRRRSKHHLWSESWNTKMAFYVGNNSCL